MWSRVVVNPRISVYGREREATFTAITLVICMLARSWLVDHVDLVIYNYVGDPGSHRNGLEGRILTVGGCIHALRLPADMQY